MPLEAAGSRSGGRGPRGFAVGRTIVGRRAAKDGLAPLAERAAGIRGRTGGSTRPRRRRTRCGSARIEASTGKTLEDAAAEAGIRPATSTTSTRVIPRSTRPQPESVLERRSCPRPGWPCESPAVEHVGHRHRLEQRLDRRRPRFGGGDSEPGGDRSSRSRRPKTSSTFGAISDGEPLPGGEDLGTLDPGEGGDVIAEIIEVADVRPGRPGRVCRSWGRAVRGPPRRAVRPTPTPRRSSRSGRS